MASVNIVVDEVLCFLHNNFTKLPVSELKPVIVSFYTDDELVKAKESLLKGVQDAIQDDGDGGTLPRMPKWQKKKLVADDLLTLYNIVDERNLSAALPMFVAKDLTRIPFINIDSMDTVYLAKKTDEMENRLKLVELQQRDNETPSVPSVPSYSGAVLSGSTTTSYDGTDMAYHGCSGASNGTTSYGNTDHTDGTEVAYHGNSADNPDWKTVSNRRQKKPNTGVYHHSRTQ